MSDFSTIVFDYPIPDGLEGQWQTKDLPDDIELGCCVDGTVAVDGKFVREDMRGRYWNPTLNGNIRLVSLFSERELFCNFESGVATIVRDWEGNDRTSHDGADCDDSMWQKIS